MEKIGSDWRQGRGRGGDVGGRGGGLVGGEVEDEDIGELHGKGLNDYNNYAPPHPESEAAAALSNSEPSIPFTFGLRYAGSPPRLRG